MRDQGSFGLPTVYQGITFRSRLEARFAIFMNQLGVRWHFEPEGFNLPSGLYLPDFYLPDLSVWLEGKPSWDVAKSANIALHLDLMRATGQRLYVTTGMPGPSPLVCWRDFREGATPWSCWNHCCLCESTWIGTIVGPHAHRCSDGRVGLAGHNVLCQVRRRPCLHDACTAAERATFDRSPIRPFVHA